MKRSITLTIAGLTMATTLILGFQNCSGGSMPDVTDTASQSAAAAPLPVELYISSTLVAPGSTQTITAINGSGNNTFSITSGACTIEAVTGLFTAAAAEGVTCGIKVSDGLTQASGNITTTKTTVVTPTEPVVNQATLTFDGSQDFTVPAYNTLIVEVYGGGGGGAGLTYIYAYEGIGGNGGTGGESFVRGSGVEISASGGGGGSSGQVRVGDGSPGGPGQGYNGNFANKAGTGGGIPEGGRNTGPDGGAAGGYVWSAPSLLGQPGGVPGGGGGALGYSNSDGQATSGGGGGGGYAKSRYAKGTVAVGTKLAVHVGAGGEGGRFSTRGNPKQGADGGRGRVVITVK